MDSQGLRLGSPAVIRLETADKAQDALNFGMWLATGQRLPDCVILRLVAV